jgi:hypothetical protein
MTVRLIQRRIDGVLASESGEFIVSAAQWAAVLNRGSLMEWGAFADLLKNATSEVMQVFKAHL